VLGRRGRLCSRALLAMDASGALLRFCLGGSDTSATSDAVTRERQLRLAAKAARMDTGEYLRYAEARQVHTYIQYAASLGLCTCSAETPPTHKQVTFLPGGLCGKGNRATARRFCQWLLGTTSSPAPATAPGTEEPDGALEPKVPDT